MPTLYWCPHQLLKATGAPVRSFSIDFRLTSSQLVIKHAPTYLLLPLGKWGSKVLWLEKIMAVRTLLSCQMGLSDGAFLMIKHSPLPNGNQPISSPVCPLGVEDTLEQYHFRIYGEIPANSNENNWNWWKTNTIQGFPVSFICEIHIFCTVLHTDFGLIVSLQNP